MIQDIYKPLGMTPLQALEEFRWKNPEYQNSKMTYAGRLDPMAEGVLILLIDEDEATRNKVLSWGKTYEFELLLGISTDTYDVLGMVEKVEPKTWGDQMTERLKGITSELEGSIEQVYPPYSSKVVQGKPLWQWAKEGKIGQIELPRHKVYIEAIDILEHRSIGGSSLLDKVEQAVGLVTGDFRQDKIIDSWKRAMKAYNQANFDLVKMRVICSSGTYIRQLAVDMGQKIKMPAMAYGIKRTRVGTYKIKK